jgi:hypothetical protein
LLPLDQLRNANQNNVAGQRWYCALQHSTTHETI